MNRAIDPILKRDVVQRLGQFDAVDREGEMMGDRGARLRWSSMAHHQDRLADTGLPQLHPFVHQRHTEPGCAAVERSCGKGGRTETVGVGLDHRHQFDRIAQPSLQRPRVGGHCVEVDFRNRYPP